MCFDRRGDGQKPSRQRIPRAKPPQTKTNPSVKTYVCMHVLLKIGGPRCVTYFLGGPEICDKVCQGGGESQLVKNSVDGPD